MSLAVWLWVLIATAGIFAYLLLFWVVPLILMGGLLLVGVLLGWLYGRLKH